jgi:hypothetical protein
VARIMATTIALIGVAASSACSTTHLRDLSLDQGMTVTDFEYRMTLDNLAMFRTEPGSLPWHLDLTNGTAQIDGSVSPSTTFTWPPTSRVLGLSASGGVTVNWTLTPTLNDEQLGALMVRYQTTAKQENFDADFEQGGNKPATGPYGIYKGLYVWPKPGHLIALTKLVLAAEHDILIHPGDEPGYRPPANSPTGVVLSPQHH